MLYLVATLVSLSQTNAYADKPLAAIDIGHCVTRPGASSARGLPEYGFNVKVAEALNEALLGTDQWSTLLIKADNCLTLTERPAAANNQNADVFVSTHHNSIISKYLSTWQFHGHKRFFCDKFPGYSVYYSSLNRQPEESRRLAEAVSSALNRAGFPSHKHPLDEREQKGIVLINERTGLYKFDSLAVLKGAAMPGILIECGMIIDRNEELELTRPAHQKRMSDAIRSGLDQFWKNRKS